MTYSTYCVEWDVEPYSTRLQFCVGLNTLLLLVVSSSFCANCDVVEGYLTYLWNILVHVVARMVSTGQLVDVSRVSRVQCYRLSLFAHCQSCHDVLFLHKDEVAGTYFDDVLIILQCLNSPALAQRLRMLKMPLCTKQQICCSFRQTPVRCNSGTACAGATCRHCNSS